jgi:hypothetical protein
MTRQLSKLILIVGFCVSVSDAAYAELKDNIEINLFGGGSWYNGKSYQTSFPQSATPISSEFRLDHAVRAGLRVGVYTRGHWSEEFFYSYEPNKLHLNRLTAPASSTSLDISVQNYGVTALYYLNEDETAKARAFLSVGGGGTLYRLTPESQAFVRDPLRGNMPSMHNSNLLTFHYGAGVKWRLSNWLGFRADVRGYVGAVPRFGLSGSSNDPTAQVLPVSGALNNGEASAGLIFYFFGKR